MKQKLFRLIPLFMFLVFVGVVLVFSYSFTSSLGSAISVVLRLLISCGIDQTGHDGTGRDPTRHD